MLNDSNSIRSCPTIEDINNDGLPDLIRGNASGGIELFTGFEFNLQKTEELNVYNKVDIFPNPNSGILNIAHDFFNAKLQIQIFSITGQLIFFEKINEKNTRIKLDFINPGVYILKIRTDEKNIKTEKLIIK